MALWVLEAVFWVLVVASIISSAGVLVVALRRDAYWRGYDAGVRDAREMVIRADIERLERVANGEPS